MKFSKVLTLHPQYYTKDSLKKVLIYNVCVYCPDRAQRFGEQLQETNPDLMNDLRAQAQETFHRDPNSNPFSSGYNKPPEEKGQ